MARKGPSASLFGRLRQAVGKIIDDITHPIRRRESVPPPAPPPPPPPPPGDGPTPEDFPEWDWSLPADWQEQILEEYNPDAVDLFRRLVENGAHDDPPGWNISGDSPHDEEARRLLWEGWFRYQEYPSIRGGFREAFYHHMGMDNRDFPWSDWRETVYDDVPSR